MKAMRIKAPAYDPAKVQGVVFVQPLGNWYENGHQWSRELIFERKAFGRMIKAGFGM